MLIININKKNKYKIYDKNLYCLMVQILGDFDKCIPLEIMTFVVQSGIQYLGYSICHNKQSLLKSYENLSNISLVHMS